MKELDDLKKSYKNDTVALEEYVLIQKQVYELKQTLQELKEVQKKISVDQFSTTAIPLKRSPAQEFAHHHQTPTHSNFSLELQTINVCTCILLF
jgi:hypothetical protein